MEFLKKVPGWIWATIVGVATVVGLVTSMIAVWNQIESQTQKAVEAAAVTITSEIHKQTGLIGEFFEDDLYERINILEAEIGLMKSKGTAVPLHKEIQLRSMKERLEEFKDR